MERKTLSKSDCTSHMEISSFANKLLSCLTLNVKSGRTKNECVSKMMRLTYAGRNKRDPSLWSTKLSLLVLIWEATLGQAQEDLFWFHQFVCVSRCVLSRLVTISYLSFCDWFSCVNFYTAKHVVWGWSDTSEWGRPSLCVFVRVWWRQVRCIEQV